MDLEDELLEQLEEYLKMKQFDKSPGSRMLLMNIGTKDRLCDVKYRVRVIPPPDLPTAVPSSPSLQPQPQTPTPAKPANGISNLSSRPSSASISQQHIPRNANISVSPLSKPSMRPAAEDSMFDLELEPQLLDYNDADGKASIGLPMPPLPLPIPTPPRYGGAEEPELKPFPWKIKPQKKKK
jgi:hypothetical protein